MALQQQSVEVSGSQSQVTVVGRDLIMAKTYVQHKPEFFEPNLDQFKPPAFVAPKNIQQLIDVVRNQHLLVLGGSPEVDKAAIARHIAWHLGDLLGQESAAADGTIPVLEWYRSSAATQDLAVKLQKTEDPTIFILPQITPQDVNYDLFAIQKAAVGGKHFVVVSTDAPFASWKQDESAKTLFWQDLFPETLYDSEYLANMLVQRLIGAEDSLPPGFLQGDLEPDKPLVGELSVRAAAEGLRTPDNIAVFVQLLCAEREPLSEVRVRELIDLAQDNKRTLRQWYHTVLNPREQLLALGLSLFDGLFDDQFFAALEAVVEDIWQRRDASLRALDYCDLDNLRNFFRFVEAQDQTTKIESRFPEQRRTLFEVAWNSHRRQILSALPVLTQLVQGSANLRSFNAELYGTYARRRQLRNVIGETLSDIGLISTRAAQDALLTLAADRETRVQSVAASALARWRAYERHEDLFETLRAWQHEISVINAINAVLEGREEEEEEKSEGAQAYIRATMALTLGYAAQYDPPNQLSPELCTLLEELTRDQSDLVRNRLINYTLPMVVPLHLDQLRDTLHDMVRYVDLITAVGASLARAYRRDPEKVLEIIEGWHEEAQTTTAQSVSPGITLQNALLATVAMTYGYIDYEESIGPLTADEAFERLQNMLDEEKAPFVRTAVVLAISLQAKEHFEKVEPLLYKFVHVVTENERIEIVRILTELYLEQRANLEGGEETIEVEGRRYPIWVNSERPMTVVEKAMVRWIKDPSNPIAQQIATQASVAFALALEQEEKRRIDAIRTERKRAAEVAKREKEQALQPIARGLHRGGIFVDQLIPWLVTLNAAQYRPIIRGVLPEVVAQAKRNKDAVSLVLQKWGLIKSDRDLKSIASRLKSGLKLSDNMGLLIVLVLAFVVLGLCVCCCMGTSVFD